MDPLPTIHHPPSTIHRATVILKPRKAQPFYGRHPWVLESAVARVVGKAADGDVVDLQADDGRWIARGIYNGQSRIRVRLYTWNPAEELDDAFWEKSIETACRARNGGRCEQEGGRWMVDGGWYGQEGGRWTVDGGRSGQEGGRSEQNDIRCDESDHRPPPPLHHSPSPLHHSPSPLHHSPSPLHHSPSPLHHSPSPLHHSPSTIHHSSRLIFSEGDHLSGLIVDRYGDYLVIQVTALAIAVRLPLVIAKLVELTQPRGILLRTERDIVRAEGFELPDLQSPTPDPRSPTPDHRPPTPDPRPPTTLLAWGELPSAPIEIIDRGLRFTVDPSAGQKTGFYLDQRDNRYAAAAYLRGRTVLDMFCYTGGFSLAAAAWGGAKEVLGIDSSARAIALAQANAAANGITNVRFEIGEGFESLQRLAGGGWRVAGGGSGQKGEGLRVEGGASGQDDGPGGETRHATPATHHPSPTTRHAPPATLFSAVILDPPKFAHSRNKVDEALRAYFRLNRLALDVLQPGGILVTCSCSGHVSRDDFFQMLVAVAQKSGRDIQILEQRGASADHPVSVTCPETEYLKCFICRVGS